MKIRYNYKKLIGNLIVALIALVYTIVKISTVDYGEKAWRIYSILGLLTLYFAFYVYTYFNSYLAIKNGVLIEKSLSTKKMRLAEVKQIRKFAGDYILKTDTKELVIDTQILKPEALAKLDTELAKLEVEWQ